MANTDFTIADVLAWARTKPADEAYEYFANRNCALCQFLRETGRASTPFVYGDRWGNSTEWDYDNARPFQRALQGALQAKTFGSLVTRLEALCPDTVVTPSEWTRLDAYMTDIEMARS